MSKKYLPEGYSSKGLLALLRDVIEKLNKQSDIKRGGLYHTLSGAMQDRITGMGVINIPEFVLLMQELGLMRHRGGGKNVVWQVVCSTFFDEIVTDVWIVRAQLCLAKRTEVNETIRALREQVKELEAKSAAPFPGSLKSIDEIADMVVTIEKLQESLESERVKVVELESKLDTQLSIDYDAVLAAAIKRARERAA